MTTTEPQKLLCVDDESDIREIAALSLELDAGFTVKSCASGQEALEALPEFAPDMVLLDVMMPDMDGPATLERLRQLPEGRTVPVVFITAKAQRQEVEYFLSLGAVGVIAKPFDPMTLADQVRSIWESRHGTG
ncbi:response regulator [Fodinicurvata halophila]|uniref:Response regulator n=1 Tax=Fodinicurvata halophila TaxID=1419723 RepID=A0ABV8UGN3_9PROT